MALKIEEFAVKFLGFVRAQWISRGQHHEGDGGRWINDAAAAVVAAAAAECGEMLWH